MHFGKNKQTKNKKLKNCCSHYFCGHEQNIHCSYISSFVTIKKYLGWDALKRNQRVYISPASRISMMCGGGLLNSILADLERRAANHIARQDRLAHCLCLSFSLSFSQLLWHLHSQFKGVVHQKVRAAGAGSVWSHHIHSQDREQ